MTHGLTTSTDKMTAIDQDVMVKKTTPVPHYPKISTKKTTVDIIKTTVPHNIVNPAIKSEQQSNSAVGEQGMCGFFFFVYHSCNLIFRSKLF